MADHDANAVARRRWLIITGLRLLGVAAVMVGLLMLNGVLSAPPAAAYVLLALGMVDVFIVPQVLVRKWRTPRR